MTTFFRIIVLFIITLLPQLSLGDNLAPTPTKHRLIEMPANIDSQRRWPKWGRPQQGSFARITYSFAKSSMDLPISVGDCTAVEPLQVDTVDESTLAEKENAIHGAFRMWEPFANIEFVFIDDPTLADVVVGMSPHPRQIVHAFVGLGFEDNGSQDFITLTKAAVCLDSDELWTTKNNHRVIGKDKFLSLRLVTAHEVGHVLGLDHPKDKNQLMGNRILETTSQVESGDALGLQFLYGINPRSELINLPR